MMLENGSDEERFKQRCRQHFLKSIEVQKEVIEKCVDPIIVAALKVAEAFRNGNKLLICGNGGSAADAQHVASEFVSRLTKEFERPGLPAIALTTDTSFLTAYANDFGFEGVFERQVQALGEPGDVLLGISSSGNSSNVIRAVHVAQEKGLKTIGFTGQGGQLNSYVDWSVIIPSRDTQYVQEALLIVEHIMCDIVEQALFSG